MVIIGQLRSHGFSAPNSQRPGTVVNDYMVSWLYFYCHLYCCDKRAKCCCQNVIYEQTSLLKVTLHGLCLSDISWWFQGNDRFIINSQVTVHINYSHNGTFFIKLAGKVGFKGPFIIYRRGGGWVILGGDLKFWPLKKGGSWSNYWVTEGGPWNFKKVNF